MNAISNVAGLSVSETNTEMHPIIAIALFCCIGLVASLWLGTSGFDLTPGLY